MLFGSLGLYWIVSEKSMDEIEIGPSPCRSVLNCEYLLFSLSSSKITSSLLPVADNAETKLRRPIKRPNIGNRIVNKGICRAMKLWSSSIFRSSEGYVSHLPCQEMRLKLRSYLGGLSSSLGHRPHFVRAFISIHAALRTTNFLLAFE